MQEMLKYGSNILLYQQEETMIHEREPKIFHLDWQFYSNHKIVLFITANQSKIFAIIKSTQYLS